MFARLTGERQWLVFSLRIDVVETVSLALPVPLANGASADHITLHSLDAYPAFFTLLQKPFPRDRVELPPTRGRPGAAPSALEVVRLGDYAASVVPDAASLARLRPDLGLQPEILMRRPEYESFAFIVLQLRAPKHAVIDPRQVRRPVEHHAVVIDFPTRFPRELFFPTLVSDGGEVPATARYDHLLFCQTGSDRHPVAGWQRSARPVGRYVSDRVAPAVDLTTRLPTEPARHLRQRGPAPHRADGILRHRHAQSRGEHVFYLPCSRRTRRERSPSSRC